MSSSYYLVTCECVPVIFHWLHYANLFCSVLDKSIWAYSGHYKPSAENLSNFMKFLEENGVDLKEVEVTVLTVTILSHQIENEFI